MLLKDENHDLSDTCDVFFVLRDIFLNIFVLKEPRKQTDINTPCKPLNTIKPYSKKDNHCMLLKKPKDHGNPMTTLNRMPTIKSPLFSSFIMTCLTSDRVFEIVINILMKNMMLNTRTMATGNPKDTPSTTPPRIQQILGSP